MERAFKENIKADFKVADLSLADWGRKEIAIAETEMPGLMSLSGNPDASRQDARLSSSEDGSIYGVCQPSASGI